MTGQLARKVAVTAVLLAVLTWLAGGMFKARADSDGIDADEQRFINRYGIAVCRVLDGFPSPTPWHVVGIMEGIMDRGWDPDSAVDILNGSVDQLCPEYWPLLVMTGRMFRGEAT